MKIFYYNVHPTLSLKTQTGTWTHMREMINDMKELGHEVHPVIAGDRLNTTFSTGVTMKPGIIKQRVKKPEHSAFNTIYTFINDKDLCNRLAAAFHSKVMQNYTWKGTAEAIVKSAV